MLHTALQCCTAGLDVLTHHVLSHVPEVAHYGTHHVSRDPRGPGPILITITSSSANVPLLLVAHCDPLITGSGQECILPTHDTQFDHDNVLPIVSDALDEKSMKCCHECVI